MKNTGLIDLHDIEVLIHRYKAGERNLFLIPSQKNEKLSPHNEINNTSFVNNHLETSNTHQNLSQDNSQNLNVNLMDESQIPINKSAKINENNIEQKSPKITFDLARIILELHLEEIAENLVNPSDKALNPDLKPNFKMFKKE